MADILTPEQIEELMEKFKNIGAEAVTYNHYDLAEATDVKDPEIWKKFLLEPNIRAWIDSELALIQKSELYKMIQNAAGSRSVGQAQLMNTFAKLSENKTEKEGPIFVYSYVPLSEQEKHADNIAPEADYDLFT